ncbi:MAG: 4-hydroxy-tetrahydrodipicolinate synthase [Steroidobacteraceae bacterium]
MFTGSLVALVTPMHADGAIDRDAWSRLLEFQLASGTSGIVVGGTTGESPTLTESEMRDLAVAAVDRCRGRIPVIAGVGTSSTAATVERARWMSALGVDALLVVTPAYNRPTQDGLYLHFEAVAAAATVPVIVYNVPSRTAVDLLPDTAVRLSQLTHIVGIKEAVAGVERVRALIAGCRPDFCVLSGDDATAREAILAGARGVISVTANVAPQPMTEMVAAALRRDAPLAARIDARLAELHRGLFVESNPIPAKWALLQMGLVGSGIRLPLTELSGRFQPTVRAALFAAGALAAPPQGTS